MNEKYAPREKSPEKFPNPTETEVIGLFETHLDGNGYEEVSREEGESGLRKLEVSSHDDEGKPIVLIYYRSAERSDGTPSRMTIDIEYYEEGGDYPIDVQQVALYKNGEWIDTTA